MLMQSLGGQTKSIMVFSELAYLTYWTDIAYWTDRFKKNGYVDVDRWLYKPPCT